MSFHITNTDLEVAVMQGRANRVHILLEEYEYSPGELLSSLTLAEQMNRDDIITLLVERYREQQCVLFLPQ